MSTSTSTFKPLNFLITGAARGIGRGLSRLLLARGHRIFLVDSNETELFHTCDQLAKSLPYPQSTTPAPFDSLKCNLRRREDILEAATRASTFFNGHLDCLINNAAYTGGVHGPDIASESSEQGKDSFEEAWMASLETNLTAPVLLSRACLEMLRRTKSKEARDGRNRSIIHISSTRAHQSENHSEPYAATKAGLIGLTHSMAVSLAPLGISVNTVLPGWINVGNECKEADEKGQRWEESGGMTREDHEWHLTGRAGKVEEVERCVLYLVEGADFVTGTENVVDGGVSRKMVYPE